MNVKLPYSPCNKKLFPWSPIAFSHWCGLKLNIKLLSNAVTANFRTFIESVSKITTVGFSFPHIRVTYPARNKLWNEWIELNDSTGKGNIFLPPYPSYDQVNTATWGPNVFSVGVWCRQSGTLNS